MSYSTFPSTKYEPIQNLEKNNNEFFFIIFVTPKEQFKL